MWTCSGKDNKQQGGAHVTARAGGQKYHRGLMWPCPGKDNKQQGGVHVTARARGQKYHRGLMWTCSGKDNNRVESTLLPGLEGKNIIGGSCGPAQVRTTAY